MSGCNELRLWLFTHQDVILKMMQPKSQCNAMSRVNIWAEKLKNSLET